MKSIYSFLILLVLSFFILPSCKDGKIDKNKYGNCSDDIHNQNEEDVDCGGVCVPCSSCNDGVKNSSETGIDCGGACTSCTPGCTIASATLDYTLFPSSFTFSISGTASTGTSFYSSNTSDIDISLSGTGGTLVDMRIEFYQNFNPITYIPVNETMIFQTIDASSFSVDQNNHVKMTYSGNINFSYYGGYIDSGQKIFITKTSATTALIRFCNISGGSDRFSANAPAQ